MLRALGERRRELNVLRQIREEYSNVKLSRSVTLVGYSPGRLQLAAEVSILSGTILAFGDDANGYGRILVGSKTWIGQYNNLRASGDAEITIGESCLISQFCTLVGTNHLAGRSQPIQEQAPDARRRGINVGDDVWLGAGVVLLPGVNVRTGAVVGAGSVVTRDVPEYEIWCGAPAAKIGERV